MKRRSGFGWMELIIGILLIVLGIVTLMRPSGALTGIVLIYGIIAVLTGIADIVFYVRMERFTGFGPMVSLISGVLSVMSGVMVLVYPAAGKLILSMLFPIWFIAHCISRLSHLQVIRSIAGTVYYYISMAINIAGIVLGFLMAFHPYISALSVAFVVGVYLIIQGVDSVIVAVSKLGSKW